MYLFTGKDIRRHLHDYTHAVWHRERMRPVMIWHWTVTFSHRQGEANKSFYIESEKKNINDVLAKDG